MTIEEAKEVLLKMAFAESTEFAEDRLFAFGYSDEHEALNIAIEALERQIPKMPNKTIDRTWGVEKEVNVCPSCDYYLGSHHFFSVGGKAGKGVIYCENCGQAVEIDNGSE